MATIINLSIWAVRRTKSDCGAFAQLFRRRVSHPRVSLPLEQPAKGNKQHTSPQEHGAEKIHCERSALHSALKAVSKVTPDLNLILAGIFENLKILKCKIHICFSVSL